MAEQTLPEGTRGARQFPISALVLETEDWHNPRTGSGLQSPEIRKLADAIFAGGLETPPTVRTIHRNGAEIPLVIHGQRRTLALRDLVARKLVAPDHPVWVSLADEAAQFYEEEDADLDDLLERSLADNTTHQPLSTYEVLAAVDRLLDAGRTQADIGRRINRSPAWMSRLVGAWRNASPKLRDSLRRGQITDEQFQELSKVQPEAQPEVVQNVLELRAAGAEGKAAARDAAKTAGAKAEVERVERETKAKPAAAKPRGRAEVPKRRCAAGARAAPMERQPRNTARIRPKA